MCPQAHAFGAAHHLADLLVELSQLRERQLGRLLIQGVQARATRARRISHAATLLHESRARVRPAPPNEAYRRGSRGRACERRRDKDAASRRPRLPEQGRSRLLRCPCRPATPPRLSLPGDDSADLRTPASASSWQSISGPDAVGVQPAASASRPRARPYSRAKATSESPSVVPSMPCPPAAITTNCLPSARMR